MQIKKKKLPYNNKLLKIKKERERDSERERQRERDKERERKSVDDINRHYRIDFIAAVQKTLKSILGRIRSDYKVLLAEDFRSQSFV